MRSAKPVGGRFDLNFVGLPPTACDAIHTILSSSREKFPVTKIDPPADMDRSERRAYRNLAKRLADRGIDVVSRAGLIEDFVRLDARLAGLRSVEKSADSGSKMATVRAMNVAQAEKRRLHDALFRGAAKPAPVVAPLEVEAAETVNAADEAWRRYYWGKDHTYSHEQLERRYGAPGWGPLLYRTAEEQISWKRIAQEYPAGRRIPNHLVEEHNRLFPKGPQAARPAVMLKPIMERRRRVLES